MRTKGRRLHLESLEGRCLLTAASFVESSSALGLSGLLGGSGEFHGGGLTFTDLTGDGYADLYLIGPATRGNRLYVNVGDGAGGRTFARVAEDGGASYTAGNSIGSVAADYDNDGDLDVYLANYNASNILFKNMWVEDHPNGGGTPLELRFVDATDSTDPTPTDPVDDDQHGLAYASFDNPLFGNEILDNTMSAAWADVNRDGWADIYVGSWDGTNGNPAESDDGQLGERDTLYLNQGDGTFSDVTMGDGGAESTPLMDDGSFETAQHGSTNSNSAWALAAQDSAAQFQAAPWAASAGDTGVWFKGFRGSVANPADASVAQSVVAPVDGDYVVTFDARVEQSFPNVVGDFRATFSSDGTGGSSAIDLIAAAFDDDFHRYSLTLLGVTAGDLLTVRAEMIDARGGSGPQISGFVDGFVLWSSQLDAPSDWEQVGGWAEFDGSYNDPSLPAEFSGQNALQFADFNNDGWQDLVVATMGGGGVGPNRDMLYLNRGVDPQGEWLGFHLASYEIGFGGNESSDMGVAVADIDNDGDLDYFSTILPVAHPLWINRLADDEVLTFDRTTINNEFAWGANFHDFDNNGRVDLLVGTEVDRRSYLHLQDLDGSFSEQAVAAGLTSTHSTRGVAAADLDRDGFSDAAMWLWHGANPGIQLYRNTSALENPNFGFLTLELTGDPDLPGMLKSSRDALGARAYVTADFNGDGQIEANETRLEEVVSGHSNGATTSSLALEFGVGLATTADVQVVWPSGRKTVMDNVAVNQFLQVREVEPVANGWGLLAWQREFGSTSDALDLDAWEAAFGGPLPPAGTSSAAGDDNLTALAIALVLNEAERPSEPAETLPPSEHFVPRATPVVISDPFHPPAARDAFFRSVVRRDESSDSAHNAVRRVATRLFE